MPSSRYFPFFVIAFVMPLVALPAAAVEFLQRSDTYVQGEDQGLGIVFAAETIAPAVVEVLLRPSDDLEVEVRADYDALAVSVRSYATADGAPAALSAANVMVLGALRDELSMPRSNIEATLRDALEMLSEVRPGRILDAHVSVIGEAITSLCARSGQPVEASYDTATESLTETLRLGPCYNQANSCLGRCGTGCGIPGSKLVQRFSQDCFNHDVCVLRTGAKPVRGKPCDDEWDAAIDDFMFATDCGNLGGRWSDNYGLAWRLAQDRLGVTKGTVNVGSTCGTYSVAGSHTDSRVRLTASRLLPPAGCCRSFTYTGSYSGCAAVTGSWTNVCKLNGSFSLRRGRAQGNGVAEDQAPVEPAPYERRHR